MVESISNIFPGQNFGNNFVLSWPVVHRLLRLNPASLGGAHRVLIQNQVTNKQFNDITIRWETNKQTNETKNKETKQTNKQTKQTKQTNKQTKLTKQNQY